MTPRLAIAAMALGFASSSTQAQQYWDPTVSTGQALGGDGEWYNQSWWDGTQDSYWNDTGSAIFDGTPGVVTINGGVNSDFGLRFMVDGYTLNVNGYHLSFPDPNINGQYVDNFFVTNGATVSIVGASGGTGGTIRKVGGGTVRLGDGGVLANGYFGVGDYVEGTVELNNDASGAGTTSWYINLRGATIAGNGSADADLDFHSGAFSPGFERGGTGKVTIKGNMHQREVGGMYIFDIGGKNAGATNNGYDVLNVGQTGTLQAGAIIIAKLSKGFQPSLGDSFEVITAQSIVVENGALSDVIFNEPLLSELAWSNSIVDTATGQALRLSVIPAPPGPGITIPAPLAWLDFNSEMSDKTGNGHDGSPTGDAAFSTDIPNVAAGSGSLLLPNKWDNVMLANTTDMSLNTGSSFTLAVWFKITNSSSWPLLVTKQYPGADPQFYNYGQLFLWGDPTSAKFGKLIWDVSWQGELTGNTRVDDGLWHHVALTYNGSSYLLYLDGNLDGSGRFSGENEGANGEDPWSFYVGKNISNGNLDEFVFWQSALTRDQIAKTMMQGPAAPATLTITQDSSRNVVISWDAAGYRLQQNTSLTDTQGWTDVPGGDSSPVTLQAPTGSMFFRLSK